MKPYTPQSPHGAHCLGPLRVGIVRVRGEWHAQDHELTAYAFYWPEEGRVMKDFQKH